MNQDYWRQRFAMLEAAEHRRSEAHLRELEKLYLDTQLAVQKEIEAWYGRFAKNNCITLTEAKKLLTSRQLEEFKWTVEQYVKVGKQAGLPQQWMKQLENASARFHISRLEAIQMQIELLYGNQVDGIDALLRELIQNGYTRGAYEVQKGIGLGWDLVALDQGKLDALLSKPWTTDRRTFRDRCWGNKAALVGSLHKGLIQSTLRGDAPQKTIAAIQKQFGTARYQAARLVHTETSYFGAVSKRQMYGQLGVEQLEIVETLDSHTCALCQPMDGKVIPLSQYQPGVTVPPFHPNCRGTTCPHYDDMAGERITRDAEGKVYYVPADMTYAEWEKTFVEGGSKEGLTGSAVGAILKEKKGRKTLSSEMFPDYLTDKKELKNTQTLIDYVNRCEHADPDVIELYSKMGTMESIRTRGIPIKVSHGKKCAVNYQYQVTNGQLVDVELTIPKFSGDDLTGQVVTTLHEEMHLIDMFNRTDPEKCVKWFSSESQNLASLFQDIGLDMSDELKTLFDTFDRTCDKIQASLVAELEDDISALADQYHLGVLSLQNYKKARAKLAKEAEWKIDYECRNAMGGGVSALEDIYDALSGGSARESGLVRYGHGSGYYRDVKMRCEETLANYAALSIVRPDLIDMLKKDKPDLVAALEDVVKAMLEKVGD